MELLLYLTQVMMQSKYKILDFNNSTAYSTIYCISGYYRDRNFLSMTSFSFKLLVHHWESKMKYSLLLYSLTSLESSFFCTKYCILVLKVCSAIFLTTPCHFFECLLNAAHEKF